MIVRFWLKIVNTLANKYIRAVYDIMLRELEISNRNINWASLVKHLLCDSGFREVWLQQNVGDIKVFLSMFKPRLKDIFIQNITEKIEGSSRALFYRNIFSIDFPSFLDYVTVKKFQ